MYVLQSDNAGVGDVCYTLHMDLSRAHIFLRMKFYMEIIKVSCLCPTDCAATSLSIAREISGCT